MTYSDTDADIYSLALDMRRVDGPTRAESMKELGLYTQTGPGAAVLTELSRRLIISARKFAKSSSWRRRGQEAYTPREEVQALMREADVEVLSAITLETIINDLAKNGSATITKTRRALGRAIGDFFFMKSLTKANPRMMALVKEWLPKLKRRSAREYKEVLASIQNSSDHVYVDPFNQEESILMGTTMLELLLGACPDVFETERMVNPGQRGRRKNGVYVRFTQDFLQNLKDVEALYAEVTPLSLPITEEPLPWRGVHEGGFHANMVVRKPVMSTRSPLQLRAMENSDCPAVYKALNHLQSTKWEVNSEVLEVFREAVEAGWSEYTGLEIPPVEPPVSPEYPGDEVKEERGDEWRAYSNARRRYSRERTQWDRLRATYGRTLFFADLYDKKGSFHFVHGLDFRGRIYPQSGALNPQGPDFERSLTRFHVARPLGTQEAVNWFLIHGANCWGEDKLPLDERVQWAHDQKEKIIAVHEDPLSYRWWVDADKPWAFLAWCLEAGEYLQNPSPSFESKIPVAMDGTANGLQCMSLLLRDPLGALATNCVETDRPADIYGVVADRATARLEAEVRAKGENAELADAWLRLCEGAIPRKATKRIVMTTPYSSQPHSHQGYVSEWYYEIVRSMDFKTQPFHGSSSYTACDWLARVIREELHEVTSGAKRVMDFLRELAEVAAIHGVHMTWQVPTGLQVVQRYRKSNKRSITVSAGRRVKVHVFDEVDLVDKNKSANAVSPNLVHSLDAAAATLTVNAAFENGIIGFQAIHDSFAVHAADAPTLATLIREAYITVFSEDILEQLHGELKLQLPAGTVLPEVPSKGDLNINTLAHATYFFS